MLFGVKLCSHCHTNMVFSFPVSMWLSVFFCHFHWIAMAMKTCYQEACSLLSTVEPCRERERKEWHSENMASMGVIKPLLGKRCHFTVKTSKKDWLQPALTSWKSIWHNVALMIYWKQRAMLNSLPHSAGTKNIRSYHWWRVQYVAFWIEMDSSYVLSCRLVCMAYL